MKGRTRAARGEVNIGRGREEVEESLGQTGRAERRAKLGSRLRRRIAVRVGAGGGHRCLTLCLIFWIVALFSGFVADQAEHAAHNVADGEFCRLGLDESTADLGNVVDEDVDVLPFRARDDLEKDMGSGDGAGLGTLDLTSLEEAIPLLVDGVCSSLHNEG